jgi:hypothetical protein
MHSESSTVWCSVENNQNFGHLLTGFFIKGTLHIVLVLFSATSDMIFVYQVSSKVC